MYSSHEFDIEEDNEIEELRHRHQKIQLLQQAFSHPIPVPKKQQHKENLRKTLSRPINFRKHTALQENNCNLTVSTVITRKSVKEQTSQRSKANTSNVVQRLYAKEQHRQDAIQKKKEQLVKQELQATKPKPDINRKSKELTKSKGNLIMLDTRSNLNKRKDFSPIIHTNNSRTNSVKSVLRNDNRSAEFIKSQQEWLVQRNAALLEQRIEMKSRELDGCTHKPQISKRALGKSRIRGNDSLKESQITSRLGIESQYISRG